MDIDAVAREIAKDLFTDGSGERAERLVLTVDSPPARTLGGWSKGNALARIKKILKTHADPKQ